jgi:hypothetical protein
MPAVQVPYAASNSSRVGHCSRLRTSLAWLTLSAERVRSANSKLSAICATFEVAYACRACFLSWYHQSAAPGWRNAAIDSRWHVSQANVADSG